MPLCRVGKGWFWLPVLLSARFMIDWRPKRINGLNEQGSFSHLDCSTKTGRVLPFKNQLSQIALASRFSFNPHTISKPAHIISLQILTIHLLYTDRETRMAASMSLIPSHLPLIHLYSSSALIDRFDIWVNMLSGCLAWTLCSLKEPHK